MGFTRKLLDFVFPPIEGLPEVQGHHSGGERGATPGTCGKDVRPEDDITAIAGASAEVSQGRHSARLEAERSRPRSDERAR